MASRIRYKKTGKPNELVSRNIIQSSSTGAKYLVYINTEEVTYRIKNLNTERLYHGGENINNMNVLKRNIKAKLEKSFGVVFETETRDRTFGVVPKGMTQAKWEYIKNNEPEK